ncbi:MAG TPA: hypothetical protein VFR07_03265 [Mycobacteriales bacterium]|nr:hypothetical protein [Mycobacteriales bacterium]
MTGTDVAGFVGYVLAAPFTLYPPLFKRMWNDRDLRLLAIQEVGVALIVVAWAARRNVPSVVVNGGYGLGLALAYAYAGRRR